MYRFMYIIMMLVPYISQLGNEWRWDCGAASVSMVLEYSTGLEVDPGDFMEVIGRDRYLTATDLVNLMGEYGLVVEWGEGVPRIVLLNGNHWVVYLGDGYYHDPIRGPYREGWLGSGLYISYTINDKLYMIEE